LICIFLCVTSLIKAQPSLTLIEQAKQKELLGLHFEASILFDRVLFEENLENTFVIESIFGKVRCLKKMKLFVQANNFIKANINLLKSDSLKYQLQEDWILNSYLTNQLDECISIIEQTKLLYPSIYNKNWLLPLHILCLNEQRKWLQAKQVCLEWYRENKFDTTTIVQLYSKIPKLKSEDKAAWLSTFIPGAGQLYAGKPFEALASIIIQGAGIYYGVISFQDKYYLSSILIGGGIFGSFHFGGVRRSEELVRQYNLKKSTSFNVQLRKILLQQIGK
jgi:TM2 domain-containing membrane protein YozV